MVSERLLKRALVISEQCLSSGALVPLQTTLSALPGEDGTSFELRHLNGATPKHLRPAGPKQNPFQPWDPRLEVEMIGTNHALILNKYPVQIGHMLLITSSWRPQSGWLDSEDWKALTCVDADTTGLWFFNSAPDAGASQPHRHLQLLPRLPDQAVCPREKWFRVTAEVTCSGGEDVLHHWARVAPMHGLSDHRRLCQTYQSLCEQLGLGSPDLDDSPLAAYNILLCQDWMAVIRREVEGIAGFSVNALGFAGCLLSTDDSDIAWIREHGPEALLRAVLPAGKAKSACA